MTDLPHFSHGQSLLAQPEPQDRKKPYTDQEIADYIKGQKIDIARRTIAKYREELGIKSASKRKIKII